LAKSDDKRPWLKFYPQDWRGDEKLRVCSIGARGLWVEMMCVMHSAEPYGHLLVNGKPVSAQQIAALAGISATECAKLLAELQAAGVPSRTDDGVIYSRRMVRDKAKADRDKANGKGGGNPKLKSADKAGDKRGVNPQDKAHIPEARVPDNSEAKASDAGASRDFRKELFDRGLETLRRLTGKGPDACRAFLGKCLAAAGDDAVIVLGLIDDADRNQVVDPSAWISARLKEPRSNVGPVVDVPIEDAVKQFAKLGRWMRGMGPEPGMTGCRASVELLAKHGIGPDGRKLPPKAA
jgi:hypothetical protein